MTTKPHWSEIEAIPQEEARRLQDHNLLHQIAYVLARSAFYREKLAGFRPESITGARDLAQLPFTTKDELRDSLAAHPPLGRHLAADPGDIIQIQASSGTTGSPSYVGLTRRDVEVWNELGARAMWATGLRTGDRCLHAFGMSRGFVGGLPMVQILQFMGVCEIPIGAEAGVDRLLRVLADQRPNTLIGTPNFLLYLAEEAPTVIGRQAAALGIERISTGGEPGGGIPSVRARLEGAWGARVREMLGGTDLACTYWGECEQGDGMHFLSPDLMVAELIDPDTGAVEQPVEGAVGELVYTALRREASPVVRFRTGDRVVVTGTDCSCGRTGFKIRCVGRTDDMLIVRGINLFPSALQDVVNGLRPRLTGLMRIVADFPGHSTNRPLLVQVETALGIPEDEIEDASRELTGRIASALSVKTRIEPVPPGTLPKPGREKVSLVWRPDPVELP